MSSNEEWKKEKRQLVGNGYDSKNSCDLSLSEDSPQTSSAHNILSQIKVKERKPDKILIVDDQDFNLEALEVILKTKFSIDILTRVVRAYDG